MAATSQRFWMGASGPGFVQHGSTLCGFSGFADQGVEQLGHVIRSLVAGTLADHCTAALFREAEPGDVN